MCRGSTAVVAPTTVYADSTTNVFFPAGAWIDTADARSFRATVSVEASTSTSPAVEVTAAIQVCNNPDDLSSGTVTATIGDPATSASGDDYEFFSGWKSNNLSTPTLSVNPPDYRWFRPGFMVKLSGTGSLAMARASAQIEWICD